MFGENLKALRKQRGFSQEELAERLHVVRQTVSKWEKGLSVPDADTLVRLAELLDVTVAELLGAKVDTAADWNDIAQQLSRINEQLAIKNRRSRRIWKGVGIVLAALVLLQILGFMTLMALRVSDTTSDSRKETVNIIGQSVYNQRID